MDSVALKYIKKQISVISRTYIRETHFE